MVLMRYRLKHIVTLTSIIRDAESRLPGILRDVPGLIEGLDPVRCYSVSYSHSFRFDN